MAFRPTRLPLNTGVIEINHPFVYKAELARVILVLWVEAHKLRLQGHVYILSCLSHTIFSKEGDYIFRTCMEDRQIEYVN